jgi:hypothetical protein
VAVVRVGAGARLRSFAGALLTFGTVGAVLAAGTAAGFMVGVTHTPVPRFLENTLLIGVVVMIPLWIIGGLAGAAVGFLLVAGALSLLGLSVPAMLRRRTRGGHAADEGHVVDLVRLADRVAPHDE